DQARAAMTEGGAIKESGGTMADQTEGGARWLRQQRHRPLKGQLGAGAKEDQGGAGEKEGPGSWLRLGQLSTIHRLGAPLLRLRLLTLSLWLCQASHSLSGSAFVLSRFGAQMGSRSRFSTQKKKKNPKPVLRSWFQTSPETLLVSNKGSYDVNRQSIHYRLQFEGSH
ncbi:hypothetical protein M9458_003596, partial [Cirrhinus mrigala]